MAVTPVAAAFAASAEDWREGTRAAAELLVGLGTAGEDYPAACVAAIEEHGPYIVLTRGVALVHAQVPAGTREGLAVLRLGTPVEFGHPTNDPVDVLLSFSSGGDHMAMIKAVARGLGGGLADRIRQAADTAEAELQLTEVLDD
ncbi:PTS sugar transporter subunit IIA [Georgenia sp. 311]|uniref:PTS sugar transporter subunit IIA n=1 Tax=Georgenia sp. 311 TaxID=2585134 RepID=UPI001111BB73|nr:PTS sugar transporter subunit IIA [Georgenia sp. 311]TNC18033.1 PTS sugar transporter subunit IIA [Georgenia sp. 311]